MVWQSKYIFLKKLIQYEGKKLVNNLKHNKSEKSTII